MWTSARLKHIFDALLSGVWSLQMGSLLPNMGELGYLEVAKKSDEENSEIFLAHSMR